jgi:hypothetical protein
MKRWMIAIFFALFSGAFVGFSVWHEAHNSLMAWVLCGIVVITVVVVGYFSMPKPKTS